MRTHISAAWLPAIASLLLLAGTARGQHYQPFGNLDIHHDLQFFAPPIIHDYGDDALRANIGWYFQYDRMQLWISRPDVTGQFDGINPESDRTFELDRTWGNRFDIGYMTEDQHGWHVGVWKVNDTGVFDREVVPGFIFDDADEELDALAAITSVNSVRANSVEVNKVFRLEPTHHGLIREPFFGVRYMQTRDRYVRTTRTFVADAPVEFDVIDPDGRILTIRQTDRTVDDLNILGDTKNDMVGFQLGQRWYMDRGHWRISAELRGFVLQNFAGFGGEGRVDTITFRTERVVSVVPPDPDFEISPPRTFILDRDFEIVQPSRNRSLTEVAVGGELRLETQYQLTRDISARFGFEMMHIGRGVIRSPITPSPVDVFQLFGAEERLVAAGITFGIEINR